MDKELLLSISLSVGVIIIASILKHNYIEKNNYLNFIGFEDMPENLKPPKVLKNTQSIIKIHRHEVLNYIN